MGQYEPHIQIAALLSLSGYCFFMRQAWASCRKELTLLIYYDIMLVS